jgi:porin
MTDRHITICRTRRSVWLLCLGILVLIYQAALSADAARLSNAFSWNLHLSLDGVDNFSGGIAPGAVGNATGKAGFAFNTARAGWWSGGRLVTEFLAIQNGCPENYVGDIQGVNNLTCLNRGALYNVLPPKYGQCHAACRTHQCQ